MTIQSRHDPQVNIRMPDEIKERVKESAKQNNRSMNSEIIFILKKALSVSPLRASDVNTQTQI